MQVNDVMRAVADYRGISGRGLSRALGKVDTWARNSYGRDTKLGTLADVADVAGCDVCIIDRETGAVVATVTPPRRAAD